MKRRLPDLSLIATFLALRNGEVTVRPDRLDHVMKGDFAMDSLGRHEQLLRVFHIIDILFSAKGALTLASLKETLRRRGVIEEMSDRNLRRDIQFLKRFGYSLKASKARGLRGMPCQAWHISPGRGAREMTAPSISLPELLSLAVAREFLTPLAGTVYWHGIGQVLAKVESMATPELIAYAETLKDGLVVHPRQSSGKYRSATLSAINRAIHNCLELELLYSTRSNKDFRKYLVQPEALVVYEGSVYVAGYGSSVSEKRCKSPPRDSVLRFFKLDRIKQAKVLSQTFQRSALPVHSLLADSITLFRSQDTPRRYRIRIHHERAKWAQEKPFHPGQRVHEQEDGSLVLEIARAWDNEMVPQLLALGEMAEVLEPAHIRDRLAETARQILDLYEHRAKPAARTRKRVAK